MLPTVATKIFDEEIKALKHDRDVLKALLPKFSKIQIDDETTSDYTVCDYLIIAANRKIANADDDLIDLLGFSFGNTITSIRAKMQYYFLIGKIKKLQEENKALRFSSAAQSQLKTLSKYLNDDIVACKLKDSMVVEQGSDLEKQIAYIRKIVVYLALPLLLSLLRQSESQDSKFIQLLDDLSAYSVPGSLITKDAGICIEPTSLSEKQLEELLSALTGIIHAFPAPISDEPEVEKFKVGLDRLKIIATAPANDANVKAAVVNVKNDLAAEIVKQCSIGFSSKITAAEIIARAELINAYTEKNDYLNSKAIALNEFLINVHRKGANRSSYWTTNHFQIEWAAALNYLHARRKDDDARNIFDCMEQVSAAVKINNDLKPEEFNVSQARSKILREVLNPKLAPLIKINAKFTNVELIAKARSIQKLLNHCQQDERNLKFFSLSTARDEALQKLFKQAHAKCQVWSWAKFRYVTTKQWSDLTTELRAQREDDLLAIAEAVTAKVITTATKMAAKVQTSAAKSDTELSSIGRRLSFVETTSPGPSVSNMGSLNNVILKPGKDSAPAPRTTWGYFCGCFFNNHKRSAKINPVLETSVSLEGS